MWIEIKKDIFESSDTKGLNYIFQLITWFPVNSIPRYNIFIDSSKIEQSSNFQQLSDIDKMLIQSEFDDAINNGVFKGKYIISNKNKRKDKNILNIEEAVIYLGQPVSIIIENSLNDSYFLKAIFQFFDNVVFGGKKKISEFLKNNWIQFVNAGGWSNIKNCIEAQKKSYVDVAAINQKDTSSYLRNFVMMDSDKQFPLDLIPDKEKLKVDLENEGNKVHILRKRAMENYLPDEVIQNLISVNPSLRKFQFWISVYDTLSNNQKDFLNYKSGFPKEKLTEIKIEKIGGKNVKIAVTKKVERDRLKQDEGIRNLYLSLDDVSYKSLDLGLQLPNFKDYFPTLFENNYQVHKSSLLNREGGTETNNEFLEILSEIHELL